MRLWPFTCFFNAVFYGMLALAIGAVTGNRDTATGGTSAILVLSFFAVGLLPLIEGLEGLRKALPWYYFDGSDPVYNGIAWGHLAVLILGVGPVPDSGRHRVQSTGPEGASPSGRPSWTGSGATHT